MVLDTLLGMFGTTYLIGVGCFIFLLALTGGFRGGFLNGIWALFISLVWPLALAYSHASAWWEDRRWKKTKK